MLKLIEVVKITTELFINKKLEKTIEIILVLLIFNLEAVFTMGIIVAQLQSDHNHLKGQFKSLANDFKEVEKK